MPGKRENWTKGARSRQGFSRRSCRRGRKLLELLGDESALNQAEVRSLFRHRVLASQLALFQGILDADAVQEEVSDDRPFPGTGRFAVGHAILVKIKKGGEV